MAAFRSGDLISRLVSDIDSLTDRWLRVRLPYAVALATGVVTVAVIGRPPARRRAWCSRLSLAASALAAPLLASGIGYRAELRLAPLPRRARRRDVRPAERRAESSPCSAPALGALRDATAAGAAVTRVQARSAHARGLGAAVGTRGRARRWWLCLAFGVEGVRSGAVPAVVLAVLALTPLAAHELFNGARRRLPRRYRGCVHPLRGSATC